MQLLNVSSDCMNNLQSQADTKTELGFIKKFWLVGIKNVIKLILYIYILKKKSLLIFFIKDDSRILDYSLDILDHY